MPVTDLVALRWGGRPHGDGPSLIFMADGVGTRGTDTEALHRTATRYVAQFEPITLLSALAAVNSRS